MPLRVFRGFLWALSLGSLANAAWMLAYAWSWFGAIPGVADTGIANAHLIHDVGIAYAVCGIGLIWCLRNPARGRPVYLGVTLFFAGHALGHAAEILAGQLPPNHWWIDLPLVFIPAVLLMPAAPAAGWNRLLTAHATQSTTQQVNHGPG